MAADQYLFGILAREAVETGPRSPALSVMTQLYPLLRRWALQQLESVTPSGSFAKGTANRSGTDIDLFISLSQSTSEPLQQIYEKLFAFLGENGYTPTRRNVSIALRVSGTYDVDLVPAKRQDATTQNHSLWRNRAKTWTKSNVAIHIAHVRAGNRLQESRVLKLWRTQQGVDFPSFYIELTVMAALLGQRGTLSDNVWRVFQYLASEFATARVMDPANTNNFISDDLTAAEKTKVRDAAKRALGASNWGEIVQ